MTDGTGYSGIHNAKCLRGQSGIFAVPGWVWEESTFWKIARTGLWPSKTTCRVSIPVGADCLFSRPRPIGPFSGWLYYSGTYVAPPGCINTSTGAFQPGRKSLGLSLTFYVADVVLWVVVLVLLCFVALGLFLQAFYI
jgi:hypothetical protein